MFTVYTRKKPQASVQFLKVRAHQIRDQGARSGSAISQQ